jgi:hypothetical protein
MPDSQVVKFEVSTTLITKPTIEHETSFSHNLLNVILPITLYAFQAAVSRHTYTQNICIYCDVYC